VFLPKSETQNLIKVWDFIAANLLEYHTIFGNKSFTKLPDSLLETRGKLRKIRFSVF
jgi:hypothetical protein